MVSVTSEMRCRHTHLLGTLPRVVPVVSGACGLSSLWDEVHTLPGGWAHSLVTGHPPSVGAFSLSSLKMSCGHFPVNEHSPKTGGWVKRRLELLLQGNSSMCPRGSFSFWENPPAHSCGSLHMRKGLSSHIAHLSSKAGVFPDQGRTCPNFQLSSASARGLPGFTTSSLFPSL